MMKIMHAAAIVLTLLAGTGSVGAWESFNTENTPELAGDEIQFIEALNGRIWIGTLSGLSRYEDGTFTAAQMVHTQRQRNPETREFEVTEEIRKAGVQAWSMLADGADSYLVGTDRGVFRMTGTMLAGNTLDNHMIAPLLRRADGTIWALGKNRGTEESTLFRHVAGEWTAVDAFTGMQIKDLLQTTDGTLWIILDGDGAIRLPPDVDLDAVQHVQRGMNVTTVHHDSQGRTWMGFWGRGIAVEADGQWTQYLRTDRSAVLRFAEDSDGAIWVATNEALWRFDGDAFSRIVSDAGPINLLFADADGRIWISAQRLSGLRIWNGTDWTVSLDSFLPMRCMADAGNGTLWAGGVLDGVHRLKP